MVPRNGRCPRRVVLYARVSTDEQANSGYSLRQQMERLREYAAGEGYEIVEEVTDAGYSGASLQRLERDKDALLESSAGSLPEDIDALDSEERHRVYRMIRMEAHLAPDGSFELGGDVLNFSRMVISSS